MPEYPREELDEMVKRWLQANQQAQRTSNWAPVADFYTNDALYSWNMGANREFIAQGRSEIRDNALGYMMQGFQNWEYPYHDVIIDHKRGTVLGFWKQIGPGKRPDGTPFQVDGLSGSWFEYGGNYQWRWQKDFFDMGNVTALVFELAGAGTLHPDARQKMKHQARGQIMPGVRNIRPEPSIGTKIKNFFAMIRIVLFG